MTHFCAKLETDLLGAYNTADATALKRKLIKPPPRGRA